MYLLDFTFEINLFSFVAFLAGIFAGFAILGLLYLLSALNSLRKKKKSLNKELANISEEDIKHIIKQYQEGFESEKRLRNAIPYNYFKNSLFDMMQDIATKFYPKSKRPLYELTIDELIMLDRYIVSKIEELLSKKGLNLFRNLKVSTILKLLDAKASVDKNNAIKLAKKYKLSKVTRFFSSLINVINPVFWFKKLIINPSIKLLFNKVFLMCYTIIGEETYKVYSKQAFIEDDAQLKELLD